MDEFTKIDLSDGKAVRITCILGSHGEARLFEARFAGELSTDMYIQGKVDPKIIFGTMLKLILTAVEPYLIVKREVTGQALNSLITTRNGG